MSHLGRTKEKASAEFSLAVVRRLSELLDRPVEMAPDCIGQDVEILTQKSASGRGPSFRKFALSLKGKSILNKIHNSHNS